MLKKKKILFLITKSNWGGAQRYIYDVASSLPKDRFNTVVALGGEGELKDKLIEAGIRTITIKGLQRDISLSKELQSFKHIWNIVKDEKPDVFHVNSSKAGGLGALIGRLQGVPKTVYSAHGWAFNEDRSLIYRFIVGFFHWLTVMFAHTTIAVSNAVKHQMRWPFAQRKIVVVQNGRPMPEFLSREIAREQCIGTRRELSEFRNDLWTGTIAELHPVKQHEVTIEAVSRLVADGISVRHLIIGEGERKEKLEKLIKDKGLEKNVFLLGHIHEAATLMRAFDIFVLASRSEAIGYTIIEAAQAGVPIVASRVGGIPEVITGGWDGLLIEPDDVDGFTDALKTLLRDQTLREKFSQTAKTRGQHFSLERMVVDTAAVYNY